MHKAFSEMSLMYKQPPLCYKVIAFSVIYHLMFLSLFPCFTSLSLTVAALGLQPEIAALELQNMFAQKLCLRLCLLGLRYLYFLLIN